MKKGDFAAACPKLEESLRLDPAVGTLMNLAECEERLGKTASAWQRWNAAADQLAGNDRRRAVALARIEALEKTVARLTILVGDAAPAELQVRRDGLLLGRASFGIPLPVDPGRHVISARVPGSPAREQEVTVGEHEHRTITILDPATPSANAATPPPFAPGAATASGAGAGSTISPGSPPSSRAGAGLVTAAEARAPRASRSRPLLGYALTGTGVALLGAGAYFALQSLAAQREAAAACVYLAGLNRCWSDAAGPLARDRRYSLLADIGFVAGGLATATGIYLLFWRQQGQATHDRRAGATGARLVPRGDGGEVQLVGTF